MDSFSVVATVLLAAVFAVAGLGKLLDLEGSQRAVVEFGVPEPPASTFGILLPIAELATAILLVVHPTARLGAFLALALLLVFVVGIANVMRHGRAPDCNCFGQVHSAPAGRRTLARNGVLAALAAIVVIRGPGPAIDTWVSARSAAELVAIGTTLAALSLALYSWWLWSQNRQLRAALARAPSQPSSGADWEVEGLAPGVPAPSFALPDLNGETRTLQGFLELGKPVMLFFMEPGCGPCQGLMPELARWQEMLSDRLTFVVLSTASVERSAAIWQEHAISNVVADSASEIFRAFNLQGTPKAILVDRNGLVAGGPAGGIHMPEVLVRSALRRADAKHWPRLPRSHVRQPELVVIQPRTA